MAKEVHSVWGLPYTLLIASSFIWCFGNIEIYTFIWFHLCFSGIFYQKIITSACLRYVGFSKTFYWFKGMLSEKSSGYGGISLAGRAPLCVP